MEVNKELPDGDAARAAHAVSVDGDADGEMALGGEAAKGGGVKVEADRGGSKVGGRVGGRGGGEREENGLGKEVVEVELAKARSG